MTLPGMSEPVAENILQARARGTVFRTIGDLLDVSGINEETFIGLSGLITTRSYQFRVRSRGILEGTGMEKEVTAVLDRSSGGISILYWNER